MPTRRCEAHRAEANGEGNPMSNNFRLIAAVSGMGLLACVSSANAACTPVHNAAELDGMRDNLAGVYCLANDVDMSSVANFTPIGDDDTPFTGHLLGNNHVIRNLTID